MGSNPTSTIMSITLTNLNIGLNDTKNFKTFQIFHLVVDEILARNNLPPDKTYTHDRVLPYKVIIDFRF